VYVPTHFEESRTEILHALIRAHPLAALVSLTPDGLTANHLPFEIDPDPAPFGTLRGHLARANPHWRTLGDAPALAIFQGPSAYVSPAWYATKRETGKVVPTWNYAVVHAHGPVRVVDDRDWLRAFLIRLTDRHEAGRPDPWTLTNAPADYIESQLAAIFGIEMPIDRLEGKWKVSQNRSPDDRNGVVEGLLREGGETTMAELVRQSQKRSCCGQVS
jgi:transcriptional regulator